MKVLNLYAGIGGNRKLWTDVEVTAVELNPEIAKIYKDLYPDDIVIVGDAHQYLLDYYKEFEFIWGSPPCPTHSGVNFFLNAQGIIRYPDMSLWQEILFLTYFFKGKFCIENVKSYYDPFIKPIKIGRHYLWTNFNVPKIKQPKITIGRMNGNRQTASKKTKAERNMVNSELGLHILECARGIIKSQDVTQKTIFD